MNFIGSVLVVLAVATIVLVFKRYEEFREDSVYSYHNPACLSANWFVYTYIMSVGYAIIMLGAGCLILMTTEENAVVVYKVIMEVPFRLLVFVLATVLASKFEEHYPTLVDKWEEPINVWAKAKSSLTRSLLIFLAEVVPLTLVGNVIAGMVVGWIYG